MTTTASPTTEPSAEASDTSSGVAVLDRAFAILNAFGPTDDRLTLTEVSRRTGLYKSTVLRLLGALEHGGFIRKLSDGQYGIGHQPLRLATLYQRSFQVGPIVEPILQQLSRDLGETASFTCDRAISGWCSTAWSRRGACASRYVSARNSRSTKAPPARCCSRSPNRPIRGGTMCANNSARSHTANAIPRRRRHRCLCSIPRANW